MNQNLNVLPQNFLVNSENLVIIGVFERSEKSIFAGNRSLKIEHLLIMKSFELIPIVPTLEFHNSQIIELCVSFYMSSNDTSRFP